MNNEKEKIDAQTDQEGAQQSSTENTALTDTSTRRELIERYGKYAIVAAPLLLFASKARAIHSRP
jgi:hypothetical protein